MTEIDITVTAESAGEVAWTTLGSTTVSYLAAPALDNHEVSWSVELPAESDKKDFTGNLTLTLVVRGYNVLHGFTVPDDTHLIVPIYTASFDRRVEVAVDDGPFSSGAVTLFDDHTAWISAIPAPDVGGHTIKARAVQGWRTTHNGGTAPRTSPIATRTITIID